MSGWVGADEDPRGSARHLSAWLRPTPGPWVRWTRVAGGPMLGPVQVGVLGETRLRAGDGRLDLGTRKQRAIVGGAHAVRRAAGVVRRAGRPAVGRRSRPTGSRARCTSTSPACAGRSSRSGPRGRRPRCWSPSAAATRCGCRRGPVDAVRFDRAVTEVHRRTGRGAGAARVRPRLTPSELTAAAGEPGRGAGRCGAAAPYADLEERRRRGGRAGPPRGAAQRRAGGPRRDRPRAR